MNNELNALELADLIERCGDSGYNQDAATMLRTLDGQLAFRIDAVTKYQAKVDEQQAEIEALKAHLVKELTDEEILIVWISSNFVRYTETGHIDEIFFNKFARAILRKAQE